MHASPLSRLPLRAAALVSALVCLLMTTAVVCAAQSTTPAPAPPRLKFTDEKVKLPQSFVRHAPGDAYLRRLREEYALEQVVAGVRDDYAKVRAVSRWVRSRWEHNGSNEPTKPDPISILREASEGKRFRCVEYAVVLSAALNAVGVPARVLALKTEDVETRESGAGHVVAEAYLADRKKWVMVDGQFDVIPTLRGKPLNAVELQRALSRGAKGLGVDSLSGASAEKYFAWVAPYLFYFDTKFDSRHEGAQSNVSLMLVPVGAKQPAVFQRKWPLRVVYTNSLRAFYPKPS